jgi:hypothetical protein
MRPGRPAGPPTPITPRGEPAAQARVIAAGRHNGGVVTTDENLVTTKISA